MKVFRSVAEYFDQLQKVGSESLGWQALRLLVARETSNDLVFSSTDKNTITLELTGTTSHFTSMDGIRDATATNPGDVCLVPAGIEARFTWTIAAPSQYSIVVEFDESLFTTYAPEVDNEKFQKGHLRPLNYAPNDRISSLIRILANELDPEQRRGRLFADTAIKMLAMELAATAWTQKPSVLPERDNGDSRIRAAVEYIEGNYLKEISLDELCTFSGLGVTHLIKLFQMATGQTPYAYVISRRVRQAVNLLRSTRLPIAHVAIESGFFRSAAHDQAVQATPRQDTQVVPQWKLSSGILARATQ